MARSAPTHQTRPDRAVVLRQASAEYVKVETAQTSRTGEKRSLAGEVAFDERKLAAIGPPVQGRVSRVHVVVGDQVKADQILLTIHAPDLAAARAALAEAKTARELADRNAQRARLLVEKGAGSEAERLGAEAALAQARTEESRAASALRALGAGGVVASGDYLLRSPIAGTVVERNVAVGSELHTDQNDPVLKIADLSNVWVNVDVYEQDLSWIRSGDAAQVEVPAFPGRTFSGTITTVGNTVDPHTRVARARVEIANADLALRPGMFARIRVQGSALGGVEIPVSAVLARRDQFFVFIKQADGSFKQREIRPGEQHGQHLSILEGVHPGDAVVTEGAILLDAEANEAL